jgi:hypothetical protein
VLFVLEVTNRRVHVLGTTCTVPKVAARGLTSCFNGLVIMK